MIREGIYQTIKPHSVIEKHGGTDIRHSVYWNLCFYPKTGKVTMFGGDKDFLRPYKTEAFDLKGELISCSDHHVEFYIINPYTNVRKFFKGTINANTLDLRYYLEDNPQQVFEDVFEYIGKAEGK